MNLAFYINELLYRYPCVIVPDFGAFITENYSAFIDEESQSIYPPGSRVFFNVYIKSNDGLLSNYLTEKQIGTFEEANQIIANEVAQWKKQLGNQQTLVLDQIGSLCYNEQNAMVFTPQKTNFYKGSFGLQAVSLPTEITTVEQNVLLSTEEISLAKPVALFTEKTQDNPVISLEENLEKNQNKKSLVWLKYAAVLAISLTLVGYFGQDYYQKYITQETLVVQQTVEEKLQKTIQEASFFLPNEADTLILKAKQETETTSIKNYHIVGGAFKNKENALRAVETFKSQGFDSRVGAENKFGMTHALYGSYHLQQEAEADLQKIKQNFNPDAWLLVMPF